MAHSLIPQTHGEVLSHHLISVASGVGIACRHLVAFRYPECVRTFDGVRWRVAPIPARISATFSDQDFLDTAPGA
jgi:hypothetical protein